MNLEPVVQSEVSQKGKKQISYINQMYDIKYHILIYVYRIYKNGTDEPICREGMETQT